MEQLLRDTQARLLEKVTALKYVDEDWGQLDYYAPHPPVKWPCALLDVSNSQWSNVLHFAQMGIVQVRVRVADMRLTNSSGAAPTGQRNKAFAIYGLLKEIHQALHGWAGDRRYSKLIRVSTSRLKREDGVIIFEVIYTTELTDNSAEPVKQTISVSPQLSVEKL